MVRLHGQSATVSTSATHGFSFSSTLISPSCEYKWVSSLVPCLFRRGGLGLDSLSFGDTHVAMDACCLLWMW